MRLHFWHGDNEVGFLHAARKIKSRQPTDTPPIRSPSHLLIIQIGERQPSIVERRLHSSFNQRHLRVPHMAWAFPNGDERAPVTEHLGGSNDYRGVGGHLRTS